MELLYWKIAKLEFFHSLWTFSQTFSLSSRKVIKQYIDKTQDKIGSDCLEAKIKGFILKEWVETETVGKFD